MYSAFNTKLFLTIVSSNCMELWTSTLKHPLVNPDRFYFPSSTVLCAFIFNILLSSFFRSSTSKLFSHHQSLLTLGKPKPQLLTYSSRVGKLHFLITEECFCIITSCELLGKKKAGTDKTVSWQADSSVTVDDKIIQWWFILLLHNTDVSQRLWCSFPFCGTVAGWRDFFCVFVFY